MNHCCEPNCVTQKWAVDGEIVVGFFTNTFIPKGTELTFDYNFERYSSKTIECKCGAPSCTGFIGGDASAKTMELVDEDEMDEDNTSPTGSTKKKVVQRDLLGRALKKEKEEKAWAPGMSEGWSSDEFEDEGEDEGTGGVARKPRKPKPKRSPREKYDERAARRKQWLAENPDATPFDVELFDLCDRHGGIADKPRMKKFGGLVLRNSIGSDKGNLAKLLGALQRTKDEGCRLQFIYSGLKLLNNLAKKHVLGGGRVDVPLATALLSALENIGHSISGGSVHCPIGATMHEVAAGVDRLADGQGGDVASLRSLSGGIGRWATEIEQKVKKYEVIQNTSIEKKKGGGGWGPSPPEDSPRDDRVPDTSRGRAVYVAGMPMHIQMKHHVRRLLSRFSVVAVEMKGLIGVGQAAVVECESVEEAEAAVRFLRDHVRAPPPPPSPTTCRRQQRATAHHLSGLTSEHLDAIWLRFGCAFVRESES